jgi:Amt family ammonium transporter
MLESGCVSVKNEANIMMKNVVDVVFGGFTYWLFGFSMSFGNQVGSSAYFGVGEYAVDSNYEIMGPVFASFMFQLSFATTATTIVSGTMAERYVYVSFAMPVSCQCEICSNKLFSISKV